MVDIKQHKIAAIQYLRGVAILGVILFHYQSLLKSGHVGVDIFFGISGFVITLQIVRNNQTNSKNLIKIFFKSRIKRLMPALCLILIFSAIINSTLLIFNEDVALMTKSNIYSWLYIQNIFSYQYMGNYFYSYSSINWLLPTWSLATEMQIYILFLVIVLAIRKWSICAQLTIICFVSVISFVSWIILPFIPPNSIVGIPKHFAFYSPITRFWEFGAGSIACLLYKKNKSRKNILNVRYLFAPLIIFFFAPSNFFEAGSPIMLLPVLLAVIFCYLTAFAEFRIQNQFVHRKLVLLGDISYEIYLSHYFILFLLKFNTLPNMLNMIFYLIFSFLSGIAIHKSITNKFHQNHAVRNALILWLMVPLVVFTSQATLKNSNPFLRSRQNVPKFAGDVAVNCYKNVDLECRINKPTKIFLIGDSEAGSFSSVVAQIAKVRDADFHPSWLNGCPLFPIEISKDMELEAGDNRKCAEYSSNVIQVIANYRPNLIFIANQTYEYRDFSKQDFMSFVAKLHESLSADSKIVILDTIPILPKPLNLTISRLNKSLPSVFKDTTRNRQNLSNYNLNNKIIIFDPRDVLCKKDECKVSYLNKLLYKDQAHLSVQGAQLFYTKLLEFAS